MFNSTATTCQERERKMMEIYKIKKKKSKEEIDYKWGNPFL